MNPVIQDIKVICTAPEGINLVVVKVETSEPGLYGLGCATFAYRHLTVKHLIETYLKPLVVGREVNRISELWQLMHQNAYWRTGPIVNNAISGIDMALWDIKGKMAGMPVYDLFGGKVREGVPVYRHVDGADVGDYRHLVHLTLIIRLYTDIHKLGYKARRDIIHHIIADILEHIHDG